MKLISDYKLEFLKHRPHWQWCIGTKTD